MVLKIRFMDKKVAIILINYKDYAKKYLVDCLNGLRKQTFTGQSILYIVDNSSSDDSFNFLKNQASEAVIIRNEDNDGFAKGNNDAIKQAFKDNCDYIILFNMDTVIDERAIEELIKMADSDSKIGAVQARLMLWSPKDEINSLGNSTHFLGFGYCLNYRDKYEKIRIKDGADIFYPSGAAVLFKTEVLKKVSLFDETYFMYNEDQDLGWRIWLSGYRCVVSLKSIVYHKYEFSKSIAKYYFMDRNRLITIFKNYNIISLLFILPALIIMELGLLFFSIFNGWFLKKIKVWLYFLNPYSWIKIIKERKKVQKNRVIKDGALLSLISSKISYQEIESLSLKLANIFFSLYYFLFKIIIRVLNV